jgi:hemerythrin-like domain-containing protein
MHPLAQRLHDDHRRLTQVLGVLEAQIDRLARAEEIDFDLMLDAMTYITEFPNRLHHPVEDVLFARLAAIDPTASGACLTQIAEHERLFHDSAAFYALLEAVQMDEATLMRDRLAGAGREFIAAQRAHLLREEGELLPRVEQQLSDADWDSAARTASTVSDPLGGTTTPTRYQALYKAIAQAAGIQRA